MVRVEEYVRGKVIVHVSNQLRRRGLRYKQHLIHAMLSYCDQHIYHTYIYFAPYEITYVTVRISHFTLYVA